MPQAIIELRHRMNKVNCMYCLIDELCDQHRLDNNQKVELTLALYL